jgi:hypothetical protein
MLRLPRPAQTGLCLLLHFSAIECSGKTTPGGVLLMGEYPHQDREEQLVTG